MPKRRSGVTLVEVLVALVILSIAALGSGAFIGASARTQLRAAARREALDALQYKASLLEATSCGAIASGAGTVGGIALSWAVAWSGTSTDSVAHLTVVARHRGTETTLRTEVTC
jgi:prepilin-type N-terminal cleavage/methylation domain-containing protein